MVCVPCSPQPTALKNLLMQLRKCCQHPYLLPGAETPPEAAADGLSALVESSGKLQLVDSMMGRLMERGHRVLIYSQVGRAHSGSALLGDVTVYLGQYDID